MTPNEIIIRLRKTHSRRALAERTGLTPTKIYNIEHGRNVTSEEDAVIRRLVVELQDASNASPLEAVSQSLATGVPGEAPAVDVPIEPVESPEAAPEPPTPEVTPDPFDASVHEDDNASLGDVYRRVRDRYTALEMAHVIATQRSPIPTELTAEDGIRRVSNSEIQTFKRCRRKWWLTYDRSLRPRVEPPLGVRRSGSRIHDALRRWYVPDPGARVDPRDALERLIVRDWTEFTRQYASTDGDASLPFELERKFKSEVDLDRVVVAGYLEWLEETGADSELEIVEPEAYLEANLPGYDGVRIIGRLDLRVRRRYDGLRLFLDHKVVGEFTTPVRMLPLDEQMMHYQLLETLQYDQTPRVVGALYNMLRRSKRTTAATPPFYQRVEVHHNETELENFAVRVGGTLKVMDQTRALLDAGVDHRTIAYPTPTRDCAWQCPFFQVCPMFDDGSRVDAALENLYEVGDPYAHYASDAVGPTVVE